VRVDSLRQHPSVKANDFTSQDNFGGVGESVSLSVRITDAEGQPTIAVPVSWSAQRGTVPAIDSTDDNGISNVTVTLPETPGVDAVTAEADGVGSTTFTVSTQPVGGSIVFRFLDAGGYHACGITTTEQLLCWGYSADGQLGLGSTDLKPFPTLIPGDTRYRLITGGFYHSCATTLASTVWCWGNSADGRLGDGSLATEISSPVRAIISVDTLVLGGEITVLPGPQLIAQQIQAGELHTCAIDLAQHPWCWGGNAEGGVGVGELGPGNFRGLPVLVATAELFKSIAVGGLHTCGITLAGGGRCWGYNVAGQLGDGGNASSPVPVTVGGFTFRTDGTVIFRSPDPDFPLPPGPFIAAGYDHSCGITIVNQAVCWGLNQNGRLGDGTTTNRAVPTPVRTTLRFLQISAGTFHSCGLTTENRVVCWGYGGDGELGCAHFETCPAALELVAVNAVEVRAKLENRADQFVLWQRHRHLAALTPRKHAARAEVDKRLAHHDDANAE